MNFITAGPIILNLDAVTFVNLDYAQEITRYRPTGALTPGGLPVSELREEITTGVQIGFIGGGQRYFFDSNPETASLRQALAQLTSAQEMPAGLLPGGSYQDQRVFAGLPAALQAKIKEVV